MTVIDEIAAERARQVQSEGWTPEHDDQHAHGEMSRAAMAYCQSASVQGPATDTAWLTARPPSYWPWAKSWWKPKDKRRDLIRAAALIVAEIERLDRRRP